MVDDTLLRTPAIFTLAGSADGEAVVIERTTDAAFVPAPPVAANHWASAAVPPYAAPPRRIGRWRGRHRRSFSRRHVSL